MRSVPPLRALGLVIAGLVTFGAATATATAGVLKLRAEDAPFTAADSYVYTPGASLSGSEMILPGHIEATSTVLWPGGAVQAAQALAFAGGSIDPATLSGQIVAIGYEVGHDRPSGSFSHPFRVAIFQNGRFYQNADAERRDNVQDGVYTVFEDAIGSPASNWHEVDATTFLDPSSTPDLSPSGAPISLALVLRHGASSGTSQTFVSAFGIDAASLLPTELLVGVRPPRGFVPIGAPGNPCIPQTSCLGSVPYPFGMARFEVTVSEWVDFLNAVAADDPNDLYSAGMESTIARAGAAGSYTYSAPAASMDLPIRWVSFWDATRYANWLHNGGPTGPQGDATTENGAYTLTPEAMAANSVVRNPGAKYFLPTLDEWTKAGRYVASTQSYWATPTSPTVLTPTSGPGSVFANYATLESESDPSPFGSHHASVSPNGTYDQTGNVSEWLESILSPGRLIGGGNYGGVSPLNPTPSDLEFAALGFRVASRVEATPVPGLGLPALVLLAGLLAATGRRSTRLDA